MYGMPEPLIIEDTEPGRLVASISITREPVGEEPYIAISYRISLRVFCIAYALSKLEEKKQGKPKKAGSGSKEKQSDTSKQKDPPDKKSPPDKGRGYGAERKKSGNAAPSNDTAN